MPPAAPAAIDVLIMAHGSGERLRSQLGDAPKQFLDLGSEPIIGRTVRLLRELTTGRIGICAPLALRDDVERLGAEHRVWRGVETATLLQNMYDGSFRQGSEAYLLGDVVWSRAALRAVVTEAAESPIFFGRLHSNTFTQKHYGELYAVRASREDLAPHVRETMLWGASTKMRAPLRPIADWTDDIDTPEDLALRLPLLREFARLDG